MEIKERNTILVYILAFITIGIYMIYWLHSTKKEMNKVLGANIPTSILIIIPIANWYWMYKYAEAFSTKVKKDDNTVLWAILFILLGIIAPAIVQPELNKLAGNSNIKESKDKKETKPKKEKPAEKTKTIKKPKKDKEIIAEHRETLETGTPTSDYDTKKSNWRDLNSIEKDIDNLHKKKAEKPETDMEKRIDQILSSDKKTRKPSNVIYVVNKPQPGQVKGDWAVRGHHKIYSHHRTKKAAVEKARKIAKEKNATVMTQKTDGTFGRSFKPRKNKSQKSKKD